MNSENRRSRIEDDDSLLASVAVVPLTRSARIGAGLVWAAFWAARALLTNALPYINQGDWKSALLELIGENPFDQGFSICMAWLTIEVAIIALNYAITGVIMLIAKTRRKSFRQELVETLIDSLPLENLENAEAILKRRREEAKANGASPPDNDAKPKA